MVEAGYATPEQAKSSKFNTADARKRMIAITEFSEPAPIRAVPDAAKIQARRGFEPGKRKYASGDPGAQHERPQQQRQAQPEPSWPRNPICLLHP